MTTSTVRKYLFVCGVPRSGTTAFVDLLNRHPAICLGIERFKFIAMRAANINQFNESLFEKARFFDLRATDTNVVSGDTYERLKIKYDDALIIGDKVPRYYTKLNLIYKRFPDPFVVYIARDLNATAMSWNARAANPRDHWPAANDYRRAVEEWNLGNARALEAVKAKPDRVFVVRYEEVFPHGYAVVAELLRRLGLEASAEFHSAQTDMAEAPRTNRKKIVYDGQDEYLAAQADLSTYHALLEHRIAPPRDASAGSASA